MGASYCAVRALDRKYAASAHGEYTQPTGTKAAAEHTDTRTAGAGPTCLCPANRKNSHASAADYVGTAKGTVSHDRTNRRKCAAPAHGRCAHPIRTEAAAERTSDHATGAGPSHLCPAGRKRSRASTVNHAREAATAAYHSERAIGGKHAASAHERYTYPDRTEAAAEHPSVHYTRTVPTRLYQTGKEIPRRTAVCAGSSSY